MKTKKKWIAALALGTLLGAGFAYAGTRKFTAVCNTTHGLGGSWWGTDRTTRADAEADAATHKRNWPGHSPDIFDRVQ